MSEINEQEIFAELEKDELNEDLIKDNTYPFIYAEKNYRVVMPTQLQLTHARQYKNKIFVKLITEGIPLQKNWIKTLKETQDVDIDKMNEDIQRYEKDLIQQHISKAKTKDSEEKVREKIDKTIEEIKNKRLLLILEKTTHLEPCAEPQAREGYFQFLTAQCTEILVDEKENKWEKVWKSWDDYEKDQSNFSYIALGKLTDLIYF